MGLTVVEPVACDVRVMHRNGEIQLGKRNAGPGRRAESPVSVEPRGSQCWCSPIVRVRVRIHEHLDVAGVVVRAEAISNDVGALCRRCFEWEGLDPVAVTSSALYLLRLEKG